MRSINSDRAGQVTVLLGQLHGVAQRRPAVRNDADLVQHVGVLAVGGHQGVARFVIGDAAFFFSPEPPALAFRAGHHFLHRIFQVLLRDAPSPCRRAASSAASLMTLARSAPENPGVSWAILRRSTSRASGLPAACNLQDRLAAVHVRRIDHHLAVETARPKQRPVEHLGPIRRRQHDHAHVGLESVHAHQQLIQRLLALVVDRPHLHAALAADGIQFVDEHDARRLCLGLFEQVAHPRAPTPTNISTNSLPLIEKNGTWASPATARASSVLPVPGGPTSSTPLGILRPQRRYRSGFLRNSTTSSSSYLASSQPATSSNRDAGVGIGDQLGLARAEAENGLPMPPTLREISHQMMEITPMGIIHDQMTSESDTGPNAGELWRRLLSKSRTRSGSSTRTVRKSKVVGSGFATFSGFPPLALVGSAAGVFADSAFSAVAGSALFDLAGSAPLISAGFALSALAGSAPFGLVGPGISGLVVLDGSSPRLFCLLVACAHRCSIFPWIASVETTHSTTSP